MSDEQKLWIVWGRGRASCLLVRNAKPAPASVLEDNLEARGIVADGGWCREVTATEAQVSAATRYCEAVRGRVAAPEWYAPWSGLTSAPPHDTLGT